MIENFQIPNKDQKILMKMIINTMANVKIPIQNPLIHHHQQSKLLTFFFLTNLPYIVYNKNKKKQFFCVFESLDDTETKNVPVQRIQIQRYQLKRKLPQLTLQLAQKHQ